MQLSLVDNFTIIIVIKIITRKGARIGRNLRQDRATPPPSTPSRGPPAALPPACHCGRMFTNEPTNKQTNKHNGSQYLLVEVIIRKVTMREFTRFIWWIQNGTQAGPLSSYHRRRSSVNFFWEGETFLPENICMKNLQNARILHDICPKKINKIPEFCMIFSPKNARISHDNCPKNIFSRFFLGGANWGTCPLFPFPSPTPIWQLLNHVRRSHLLLLLSPEAEAKVKSWINPSTRTRPWATGRHLPYGITQCYLPPDTSEHAPP